MSTKIDDDKLYRGDCFISHKLTLMFSTTSALDLYYYRPGLEGHSAGNCVGEEN